MKTNYKKITILVILALVVVIGTAFATSHLPPAILKIQEANTQIAQDTLKNVSFIIAFLAGMTTILSPCALPLLPAFFAFTFKEKKQITKMTIAFFIGFTIIFVAMGLIAATVGKGVANVFQDIGALVPIVGWILIGLGVLTAFGWGFTGFVSPRFKKGNDFFGILIYGVLFAVGWTACVGPILSGVLLIASALGGYLTATYLMVSYSLGIFVPLFVIAFFYDRYNLGNSKWLKGKEFEANLFGKKVFLHTNHLISGALLAFIGAIFVIFGGTWLVNSLRLFGLKDYYYIIQDLLIENVLLANIIGTVILVGLGLLIWFAIKKKKVAVWR